VDVETETDDITEYSYDDLPTTGWFGLYDVLHLCINLSQWLVCSITVF